MFREKLLHLFLDFHFQWLELLDPCSKNDLPYAEAKSVTIKAQLLIVTTYLIKAQHQYHDHEFMAGTMYDFHDSSDTLKL